MTESANRHVNFVAQAATGSADRLSFSPPFCAACMLMRAHDCGVDDEIFEVWLIGESCQRIVPDTRLAPPAEAVPIAKFFEVGRAMVRRFAPATAQLR